MASDDLPDGLSEAFYRDVESAIHIHMGHDGQSDEANDWVTDLMSAIAPLIEREVRALTERLDAAHNKANEKAAYLRSIAGDVRTAGDMRLVRLSDDGVTDQYITLADELWMVALALDGRLSNNALDFGTAS